MTAEEVDLKSLSDSDLARLQSFVEAEMATRRANAAGAEPRATRSAPAKRELKKRRK